MGVTNINCNFVGHIIVIINYKANSFVDIPYLSFRPNHIDYALIIINNFILVYLKMISQWVVDKVTILDNYMGYFNYSK